MDQPGDLHIHELALLSNYDKNHLFKPYQELRSISFKGGPYYEEGTTGTRHVLWEDSVSAQAARAGFQLLKTAAKLQVQCQSLFLCDLSIP